MKIHPDCRPCLIKQMENTAREAGADSATVENVRRVAVQELARLWKDDLSPPAVSAPLYQMTGKICGSEDPYRLVKAAYTRKALHLLPTLQRKVMTSPDPFEAAVRVAIAGNIIDFGTGVYDERAGKGGFFLEQILEEYLEKPLFIDHIPQLKTAAAKAGTVLFLGDNAGETVFDRPLLGLLTAVEVIYAARDIPIINDATVKDAEMAGIQDEAALVSSGSRMPGTVVEDCTPSFREIYRRADVIIAKGQGNFETLTEEPADGKVFMLFSIKCKVAAKQLGGETGEMVVMKW